MPSDEEMLQAMRGRGGPPKKALVLGGLGVLVVLAVGVTFALRGGSDANRHFSALSRCLIGPPLAPGENVFFRLREAELGSKLGSVAGPDAWPGRCAPHATALFRAVEASGKSALLRRLLAEQLNCGDAEDQPCKFPEQGHLLGKADELWKAADIAGITLIDVPDVPMPEPRIKPEHGAGFPILADGSYTLADHRITDTGELWLLFSPDRSEK